jgi:hypothetical protein
MNAMRKLLAAGVLVIATVAYATTVRAQTCEDMCAMQACYECGDCTNGSCVAPRYLDCIAARCS